MIKVLKDALLAILVLVLFLGAGIFWLTLDSKDEPDTVSIEYDCKKLQEYSNLPDEVIKECELIKGKNNVRQLDQ
jgi:hypothetical protein